MMCPIKLGIAEDHPTMRKALVDNLSIVPNFEVVLEAVNGSDLLGKLKESQPDILLLDLAMPILSGTQVLPMVKSTYPELQIIIFSSHSEEEIILNAFMNGADAYLCKYAEMDEIIKAIEDVHEKGYFINEHFKKDLLSKFKPTGKSESIASKDDLTKREIEILGYMCKGIPNKIIAQELFISVRTVENHRMKIFEKTKTKGMVELLIYSLKNGLFIISD